MASSHSRANALLRMLRLLLQYCLDHGAVSRNVAAGLGLVKLPGAGRIVTQAQRDALLATARDRGEPNLALAILLGWYTGQRLGDLLGAGLDVATSNRLALRQSKTGAGVGFKLAPLLRPLTGAALARAVPGQVSLLVRDDQAGGVAFTDSTFNKAFVALRSAAAARHPGLGLEQVRFKDLRPTAITNLARAGASRAEISAVSGHSLRSIDQIMTDHYLILDDAMGDAAIDRLERWELSQLPTPPREELA
jgi:integrase